jgi:hypothetical protein
MKKIMVMFLILGCVSAALYAQNIFQLGAGAHFTADFTSIAATKDGRDAEVDVYGNSHLIGGGIYAFLDITYLELNVGFLFGNTNNDKLRDGASDAEKRGTDITAFKIGAFGKYPIALSGFTLFPMLGLDGQIFINGRYDGDDLEYVGRAAGRESLNQFWFKTGVGLDIPVGAKVSLRPEFLYGIRLNTDSEREQLDVENDRNPKMVNAIIGHGLDLRFAFGYKF